MSPYFQVPPSVSLYLFSLFQDVSLVGVLWLSGLYISSLSSCLGSLYGGPRILQSIASSQVIPLMAFLGEKDTPQSHGLTTVANTWEVFVAEGRSKNCLKGLNLFLIGWIWEWRLLLKLLILPPTCRLWRNVYSHVVDTCSNDKFLVYGTTQYS